MEDEKCAMGCGRGWKEEGGENGFEDCVSAYHKVKSATPTGTNENGGKEYKMTADVGFPLGEVPSMALDMNAIKKLAEDNGFISSPIQLQSQMGIMNVPAWQKDVMEIAFWDAITKALGWDSDTAMSTGMRFFELCLVGGWNSGVQYLSELIKKNGNTTI